MSLQCRFISFAVRNNVTVGDSETTARIERTQIWCMSVLFLHVGAYCEQSTAPEETLNQVLEDKRLRRPSFIANIRVLCYSAACIVERRMLYLINGLMFDFNLSVVERWFSSFCFRFYACSQESVLSEWTNCTPPPSFQNILGSKVTMWFKYNL